MKTRIFFSAMAIVVLSVYLLRMGSSVYAEEHIVVSFDSPHENPLFAIQNMAPGEQVSKNVVVYNRSSTSQKISVRGVVTSQTGALDEALAIRVHEGEKVVYEEHTLRVFLRDSATVDGVMLSAIPPGQKKIYTFTVRFYEHAGNQFQSGRVVINILVGQEQNIPPQCAGIRITGQSIYGTDRSERLRGTNSNDLIISGGGNDIIEGRGGDDCIVVTAGNNIVFGGKGNDVVALVHARGIVFGDEGDDMLFGTLRSMLFGGPGRDLCRGGLRIGCERDTL